MQNILTREDLDRHFVARRRHSGSDVRILPAEHESYPGQRQTLMKHAENHYTWLAHYRRLCGTAKAHGLSFDGLKGLAKSTYGRPLERLSNAQLEQLAVTICNNAQDHRCHGPS